ncbi:F-actin-capping protein subunit alpha [Coemansia sp. RSA 1722]|nr:F-actin-capping protein subunit alpha [Coemansia sp. RSA 486]KAJ2229481.1 F-actin-capping protein subunit alpha [Coemansia sp. RSA 485]KAJ2599540.1 F-actin-capping protein subunit alpha [Coemansia sp. RSA 1722]
MSADDRIAKAASLLLHSPPGEVDDVFNDIRGIVNDDEALQELIEPVLAESNMQQFLVVDVPDKQSKVLLTPYNLLDENNKYLDPTTKTAFTFDHLRRIGSDPEEYQETMDDDDANEQLRAELQKALEQYVESHFKEGFVSVFAHEGSIVSCIVSNKFSPSNFWNGSWRAVWSFNPESNQLNGSIKVRVHYFEDGNVQLDTQSDFSRDVETGGDVAKKVAKLIGQSEAEFQQGINDGYRQLSEKTFKGLRRTLPVTRNKIDWEKIANYKIGGELASAEN